MKPLQIPPLVVRRVCHRFNGGQRLANLEVAASRPEWLRRRSSYGDEVKTLPAAAAAYLSPAAPIAEASSPTETADGSVRVGAETLSHTPSKPPSRLRSMFSPSPTTPFNPKPDPSSSYRYDDVAENRSYTDGHPAMLLPGGGRLPDWARDLLRSMLEPNPSARPTAKEVRQKLRDGILSSK